MIRKRIAFGGVNFVVRLFNNLGDIQQIIENKETVPTKWRQSPSSRTPDMGNAVPPVGRGINPDGRIIVGIAPKGYQGHEAVLQDRNESDSHQYEFQPANNPHPALLVMDKIKLRRDSSCSNQAAPIRASTLPEHSRPHNSLKSADTGGKTPGKKKPKRLMDAWGLKMHKPW